MTRATTRHLRLVHSTREPIVMTNPARSGGIDLNALAHAEYRERRNPVDVPLGFEPAVGREPMLPLWAIAVAAFLVVFFGAQLMRGLVS